MIDVEQCKYEESFKEDDGSTIYYFIYPKDYEEIKFNLDDDYTEDDIAFMCISLTVDKDGGYYMQMSPTVKEDNALCDIDWQDLHLGYNYTDETVVALLDIVRLYNALLDVMGYKLEDDGTETGGISFVGETVRDFINSTNEDIRDLDSLNKALKECGIKQLYI